MHNIFVKIKQAIDEIEKEKGSFKVKCLVAKEPSSIQWDLVLSADWFDVDPIKRLDYLSQRILRDFDIDCMIQFSAIITYESHVSNPLIEMLIKVQENHRLGKYDDLGQGYCLIESHHEGVKWIIPLNNPEV